MIKDPRIKGKAFNNLGGLAFFPDANTLAFFKGLGYSVYPCVEKWIESNTPDNSVIHDAVGALVDMNIPLLDAVYRHGVYHKSPFHNGRNCLVYPVRPTAKTYSRFSKAIGEIICDGGVMMVEPEVTKAASGHGKMSRGISHRKKK